MELRHLRYFVAVAEELNFTRAAARLGINQPPLSVQIRQLEKEMGAPLLRRQSRGLELTGAGKLLLEEARLILRQVERAKTGVRRRGRGETGKIAIGSAGGTYFHPLIPQIIRRYRTLYPDVLLLPEASHTPLLVARLHSGLIDAAFVRPPVRDAEHLALEPIVDEPAVMALPSGHPLSRHNSVPLAALAEETFVMFPREINPLYYDQIIAACERAGFSPKLTQEAPQIVSTVPMVACGFGVAILPQSISHIHVDGAVFRAIEGDPLRALISLAYRRNDRSAALRNFVTVARQTWERAAASQPGRRDAKLMAEQRHGQD